MKKALFAIVAGLSLSTSVTAQLREGVINYEMTLTSPDEEMQAQLDFMGTTEIAITFNKDFMKNETKNMMYVQKTIYNNKAEKGLMLQEANGLKAAVHLTADEIEKQSRMGRGNEDVKYEKTSETKDILGYKCRKVVAATERGTTTLWVTDEIDLKGKANQFYSEEAGGFALEIITSVNRGGREMNINFNAVAIKDKIKDKDPFNMDIPKGYKEMTYEEFEIATKGMRGGN